MPPYERQLYLNMPLYARIGDEMGLLEHICNSIQPNIEEAFGAIEKQEFLYNPDVTPPEWLSFLGQFVGLGAKNGKYLGFGINPDWTDSHTREVIKRAWNYWLIKGTELGIREAIYLWLLWKEGLSSQKLTIRRPFGDRPTDAPSNWWTWDTPYDAHMLQIYEQRRHFGGEGLIRYQPNYHSVIEQHWYWEWGMPWHDGELDFQAAPNVFGTRSHLGPDNLWLHFYTKEWDWLRIFPDFHELAPEIFPAMSMWETFGWLESTISTSAVVLNKSQLITDFFLEFVIDGMQYGVTVGLEDTIDPIYTPAGTIYPILNPEDYIQKITTTISYPWGVWILDYWYGQWWAQTTYSKQKLEIESFELVVDLRITSIQIDSELIIDIDNVAILNGIAGELFYAAFDIYEVTTIEEIAVPIACNKGIEIGIEGTENEDFLVIDLKSFKLPMTIGLIEGEDFVDPLRVANYLNIYYWQYPYYYLDDYDGFWYPLNEPLDTFIIDCDYVINIFEPTFSGIFGNLCNVFGSWSNRWIDYLRERPVPLEEDKRKISEVFPILATALNPMGWRLLVETNEEVFILSPTTMFWFGGEKRSPTFSFTEGTTRLYLEFLLTNFTNTQIRSCTLWLEDKLIQNQSFYHPLDDQIETHAGFKFDIPFILESGANTPEEELVILEALPKLEFRSSQLDAIIAGNQPEELPPVLTQPPQSNLNLVENMQTLLTNIEQKLQVIIENPQVDAHFTQELILPMSQAVIRHGLKKYPSVVFVEAQTGEVAEVTVTHLNENTVLLQLEPPTAGRVYFN